MSDVLPYWNADLCVAERVEDLLGRMTLPEKVGQMLQLNAQDGLERIVLDRHAGSILHTPPQDLVRAHQLVDQTRLRIPLLIADDCIHGYSFWPGATLLGSQLSMACTWNPALVREGARMTAEEVAPTGIHWTFSPVLCIARDLRWGRVDETFGEDPYLLGELGAAMVEGYQGTGLADPTAILACAKHFAGYSETMGGRDASEADISRRKLTSWFLPPFERVAKAGCRSFMLGYESIDGVPITTNEWLLNDVLRGEWGFSGTLVTDWNNVGSLVTDQKVAPDIAHAAAMAIRCGNDFIMTTEDFFHGAQQAIDQGLVTTEQLDSQVRRILTLKFEMGLFEDRREPDASSTAASIGRAEHRAVALEQARRAVVLLRNDDVLPLDVDRPRRIVVLGPNADDVQAQLGDWAAASGQVEWMNDYVPREITDTVLSGLRRLAPETWHIDHVRGCEIGQITDMGVWPDGQPRWGEFQAAEPNAAELADAVAAVKDADLAVVVVGDTVDLAGEGKSTATLELQGGQTALLEAIAQTTTPMLVVVLSSKPLALPPAALNAHALVQQFNPGLCGGQAIAEMIMGQINPSGRLPITIPRHVGQQPVFYNQIRGQHGHRYADLTQDPAFAFGEGIGFAPFEYSNLALDKTQLGVDDVLGVSVDVTNRGSVAGRETVQLYIHDEVTSVTWATKELKGFTQVDLDPGQTITVHMDLSASDCTIVDAHCRRIVEPGRFTVLVGHSSREHDLLSASFEIVSPR